MSPTSVLLDRAASCPFPTTAAHWTVLDDDVVIVAGRVPSPSAVVRAVARAQRLPGLRRVLPDLTIDRSLTEATEALVVIDALEFGTDRSNLDDRSTAALEQLLDETERFDEVLIWAYARADRPASALEQTDRSRTRAAALLARAERTGRIDATVRVERQDPTLTDADPGDRRYLLTMRRRPPA